MPLGAPTRLRVMPLLAIRLHVMRPRGATRPGDRSPSNHYKSET